MSSTCGNCDCADKSQCGKGNQYGVEIIETQQTYVESVMMDGPSENGGCQCGDNCNCRWILKP